MPDTTTESVGIEAGLLLELTFRFSEQEILDPRSLLEPLPGQANVSECLNLLTQVDSLIGVCEAVSRSVPSLDPDGKLEIRYSIEGGAVPFRPGSARSKVRRLHYGSPFAFEIALGAMAVPGIGMLIHICKRFYGIDLEFKAYREDRRQEYLEAKKVCEELEKDPPVMPGIADNKSWELEYAAVVEDGAV